jgi:hypothetical protein
MPWFATGCLATQEQLFKVCAQQKGSIFHLPVLTEWDALAMSKHGATRLTITVNGFIVSNRELMDASRK